MIYVATYKRYWTYLLLYSIGHIIYTVQHIIDIYDSCGYIPEILDISQHIIDTGQISMWLHTRDTRHIIYTYHIYCTTHNRHIRFVWLPQMQYIHAMCVCVIHNVFLCNCRGLVSAALLTHTKNDRRVYV